LTQRTNQFNLSTLRRSEAEILSLAKETGLKIWTVEASDRFGDYGMSGVVITRETAGSLILDTFLLSCRVLGRNVEQAVMTGLRKYCCERNISLLRAEYIPTAKNEPMLKFLESSGWEKKKNGSGSQVFELSVARIADRLKGVRFYYQSSLPRKKSVGPKNAKGSTATQPSIASLPPPSMHTEDGISLSFETDEIDESRFIHKDYLKPLQWLTGRLLLQLPVEETTAGNCPRAEYAAPRDLMDQRLIEIWTELLGVEKIGILDHFFDCGGNSLKAVTMLSCIHKEFQADLPLHEILKNPRIIDLAGQIAAAKKIDYEDIQPVPVQDHYRLSPAQERLHFLQRMEPESTGYNIPALFEVTGKLDQAALRQTVLDLIERHESLRTSFETGIDHVYQRVHPAADCRIQYWDLSALSSEPSLAHSREFASILEDFIRPFDLSQAPLVRVGLIRINEGRYFILCDMHHIISDGTSMGILMDEFARLLSGEKLPSSRLHYRDFATWQIEYLKGERIKKQEEFWLTRFRGEIPVLNLAADFRRPAVRSFEGDKIVFNLDGVLYRSIHRELQINNVTLHMLLLTVLNILLFKYTGQDDVIIGTPVAGRNHRDVEKIIGMFVNTLALRNQPSGEKTFRQFLNEVKENSFAAYESQEYQFEELVGKLRIARDLSRNPLFDVLFILQNMEQSAIDVRDLSFTPVSIPKAVANFDLTLCAEETDGEISFELVYCTRLFKKETMERFAKHFLRIVEIVTSDPRITLNEIDMLTSRERARILVDFNRTALPYPLDKTIQQLFEEQVKKAPENIAVVFGEARLTYRELNAKANSLARVLRENGVKPDTIVAIMAERSLEMMIGILGILKAGGAYLPIDPEYPGERVRFMLEDSKTDILLTQAHLQSRIDFRKAVIDLGNRDIYREFDANLEVINQSKDLAYVIYTSGSTGKPKGVMIEHRGVVNFIEGIAARIDWSSPKTILALTTISFDIFGLETLLPLTRGVVVVIANREEQLDPDRLFALCQKEKIDMLQVTPSRLQMICDDETRHGMFKNLTGIMVGGEAFPEYLLDKLKKITPARIYNMYGPTETTIWSTVKDLTGDASLDIGTPIANTQIYITSANLNPQPLGVAGDLFIAGDGLARGYLNRPELTAERFVDNPFIPGTKMYRTGDLARWLPDGNIEFLGRSDFQVKIRGYRIEIGEIESMLSRVPGVQGAVVTVREDTPGDKRLAAYCITDHSEISTAVLREYLRDKLPEYMIPSFFVIVKDFPKTPNGKIDRKALPAPELSHPDLSQIYCEPKSALEHSIAAIWREVLKVERVGINDNFFELGGTSLMITQVLSRIRQEVKTEIPVLKIIYENPTVGYLANYIETVIWHQMDKENNSNELYEEGEL
jgi:amino acid adenylation domain-containing protein